MELVANTLVWIATLSTAGVLAWTIYKQPDHPPRRVFLCMLLAISVPPARNTLWSLVYLIESSAQPAPSFWSEAIYRLWPIDDASTCLFAALWLHFFMLFPSRHSGLKHPATFIAIYAPALLLALAWLSRLVLPISWHIPNGVLDILTISYSTTATLLGLLALIQSYRKTDSLILRQQVRWLLWGLSIALAIGLSTNFAPGALGLPKPSNEIPGLEQLPLLVMFVSFTMGLVRYRGLDIDALINHSLVYFILTIALIGLYFLISAMLTFSWQALLIASLVTVWVAMPLRAAIQAGIRRRFYRTEGHEHSLHQFSQRLNRTRARDELADHLFGIIEQTFHPAGMALILRHSQSLAAYKCTGLSISPGQPYAQDAPLAQWLVKQRRPLYLPAEMDWLLSLEEIERQAIEGTQANVYVPLFGGEQLGGWLALGPRRTIRAYSANDLDFMAAIAAQASIALEITHLVSELEQRVSQLSVLSETSQALSSSLRTEELLSKVYQQVGRVMDASNLYVALHDPATDTVSFPLALENNQPQQWKSRQGGKGLTEYVLSHRRPLLFKRDMNQQIAQLGSQAIGTQAKSWLGVPLIANEQAIGMMAVQNFERTEAYTEDDLDILSTIALQAAVAISNAQLYEKTDEALIRRVNDLSKLYQASLTLAFSTETDEVLRYIAEMACELTGSDSAAVYHYNSQTNSFTPAALLGADLPDMTGTQVRPSGMTRRALNERRTFIIADAQTEPGINPSLRQTKIRSIICTPLISKGQAVGVIYVNSNQPNKYGDSEVQLISALASQAAVAIENGLLFKRLAEGNDRLQAVLNSTREGMMMLDNSGRIVFTNAMVGKFFNRAPADLTGRKLLEAMGQLTSQPDELLAAMTAVIYETLGELADQSQEIHKSDVVVAHPTRHIERVSVPVCNEKGIAIGRLLTLRDITEEKKAEALRQDLTRMMIHDLRSPLTSILGSLQLLEMTLVDEYNKHAVRIALSSSNRLLDLINSLLDISKMEAGQMPLKRQSLKWSKVAHEAVERVRSLATNEKIEIQTQLAPDLPTIYADESILMRVLTNLLDNAIKFAPEGTIVALSVVQPASTNGLETLCQVQDSGPGIPNEYHQQIFNKFFQVPDNAGRRKGTGLGLAFCRLAVESHGGHIWVESAPGQGSTFAFVLPAEDKG